MAKVTVIIPTFNRSQVLPRAIDSVFSQSFEDWELIVVDDGSDDGTDTLLKTYKDPRVTVMTQNNRGVSAARNLAIKASQSLYVAFLDSDDEWLSHKLQDQINYMEENDDIPLVHGEEIWVRNGVRVNPMKKHKKSGGDVFADSLKLCCISPSPALMRKTIFEEVGHFREDFAVCEDYDLWLKITSRYPVGFLSHSLIKKYGGHEDQLSRKYKAMDYWRIKSMTDLLTTESLKSDQKALLKAEVSKKCQVLLKGYRKHENLSSYDEVFQNLFL